MTLVIQRKYAEISVFWAPLKPMIQDTIVDRWWYYNLQITVNCDIG